MLQTWIGEQRVVHRLERVAGADVAAVHDLLAEGLEHGAHALEQRGVATDHHGEGALLRPDRPAAHRRVEEADAMLGEPRRDAARGGGSPEVQSTSAAPVASPASRPVGPSSSDSTSAETGKQVMTTSAPRAASAGVAA